MAGDRFTDGDGLSAIANCESASRTADLVFVHGLGRWLVLDVDERHGRGGLLAALGRRRFSSPRCVDAWISGRRLGLDQRVDAARRPWHRDSRDAHQRRHRRSAGHLRDPQHGWDPRQADPAACDELWRRAMGVDCAPDARHRVPRHAACRRRSCRVRRAGAPRPPHQRTGRRAEGASSATARAARVVPQLPGRSAGRVPHLLRDARAPAGRARTHAPNGIARRRSDERRAARARRGGHSAGRGSRQHLQAARPQCAAVQEPQAIHQGRACRPETGGT